MKHKVAKGCLISMALDEDFDVLYNLLKFYQRNTTVKSKVDIYKDKDRIEITNKSIIFPNILIIKK